MFQFTPLAVCAVLAFVPPCEAQDAAPGKDAVIAHLEAVKNALAAWDAAVEAGEQTVTPDDLAEVKLAGSALGEGLEALQARVASNAASASTAPSKGEQVEQVEWVEQWSRALLRTDQPAEFESALDAIGKALGGDDARQAWAAMRALAAAHEVSIDRARFRSDLVRWLEKGSGETCTAAAYALIPDREPDDLARVQALWPNDDPAVARSLSHLLMVFGNGKIDGRSEDIILELLNQHGGLLREALRGLWGAELSAAVQSRLVQLETEALASGDRSTRHDVVYFALSTLPNKNTDVVDRLIEAVTDPDPNNSGRALWGLGYGIEEPSDRRHVADVLIDIHNTRVSPQLRHDTRRLVERYGTPEQVDQLN